MRWLFVIARQSSFIYKVRVADVQQIGYELGVRYVVEGSVRKTGTRVRIVAQLIETDTGAHIWADRHEGDLRDVFALQDEITERIVSAVELNVQNAEIRRARTKPTDSLPHTTSTCARCRPGSGKPTSSTSAPKCCWAGPSRRTRVCRGSRHPD